MKFWFFAVLLPGLYAFTDSLVDSSESPPSLEGEVFIKSFTDDGGRVRISVLPVHSEEENSQPPQRETIELCSSAPRALLEEAFHQGKLVKVQYSGLISRCVASVRPVSQEI